ncbi:hypothetical protein GGF40_004302 [Coemansia sp. RSA 1286]|nr:hypothetical protein GGF40_004302 [Coemansia sp. RSA 1286]
MSVEFYAASAAIAGASMLIGLKKYKETCGVQLLAADDQSDEFKAKVSGSENKDAPANIKSVISTQCTLLTDPESSLMVPTPYLCGGMLQTVYCTSIGLKKDAQSAVEYDRQTVTMSDNGTISVDWYPTRSEKDSHKPIAIIMPGLGGSSYEYHIRCMVKVLASGDNGYRVAVMNHRGSGRTPLTSGRLYNGYDTEDFRDIVNLIVAVNPNVPVVGMGYSLGANLLTKYLGEVGSDSPFSAAIAICCPFDTEVAGRSLDAKGFLNDNLFQPNLVATIKRVIKRNLEVIKASPINYDIDAIMRAKRMSELDNLITAKTYGHKNCWAYYKAASSTPYVDNIKTPYLAINSLDDPITPYKGIPMERFRSNPYVALALVKHGGHLGFFSGMDPKIWYLAHAKQFFDVLINNPTP